MMDIEFSLVHEMVYMHDIANSNVKKKPRIPLKKFISAEKVITQKKSWALNLKYANVNSANKVNDKNKVKNSHILRSVNDEFSLTGDEIDFIRKQLILSSIDSLSTMAMNSLLFVLFTSAPQKNNNRKKMSANFNLLSCARCC